MMKGICAVIVAVILAAGTAFGEFPDVPEGINPTMFLNLSTEAEYKSYVYLWSEDGFVCLRIVPDTVWYLDSYEQFRIVQGEDLLEIIGCETDDSSISFDTLIYDPITIKFTVPDLIMENTFRLMYDGNRVTNVAIYDPYAVVLLPYNGIWKSNCGILSVHIQKYQTGSCSFVVAAGDNPITAFVDQDFTNGLKADDLNDMGYMLSLKLVDRSHGALTVSLPRMGVIEADISLMFGTFEIQ